MRRPSPTTYAVITMYTGGVATLGGNAAVADWNDPLAVVISAFPALALLVTFEMVVRGKARPSRRRWYHQAARLVPALAIMGIAAYASYGHLLKLASTHGQHGASAYLLAALPDAMMLLATAVIKDSPAAPARRAARQPAAAKRAPAKTAKPAAKPARKPARRTAAARPAGSPLVVPASRLIVPTAPLPALT